MSVRAAVSLADPWFIWYHPIRTLQDGQRIAAAHQTNQKMQIGKYRAIVRPSGRRAGLPCHSEKKATEMPMAASVAISHTRYFQR